LRGAGLSAVGGVALWALAAGWPGRLGLLLLGASLAPVYPTLMARTPVRVGPALASHTVGFLVSSATLGSSLLPALIGVFVGRIGLGAIAALTVMLSVVLALLLHRATAAQLAP
jgi:fucose permease